MHVLGAFFSSHSVLAQPESVVKIGYKEDFDALQVSYPLLVSARENTSRESRCCIALLESHARGLPSQPVALNLHKMVSYSFFSLV